MKRLPRNPVPAPGRFFRGPGLVWLTGLFIQLKRAGLGVRRLVLRTPRPKSGFLPKQLRVAKIQFRRAGWRARGMLHSPSAWTLGAATGTLGILLMILLQFMYSFQMLGAKESPEKIAVLVEEPKTRIDPGQPQTRKQEPVPTLVAQLDPFAPPEPDPFAVPPQEVPDFDPNRPAMEPVPHAPISEPVEPEPFIDPLDILPSLEPVPREFPPNEKPLGDAFDPVPAETQAPAVAVPNEFPAVDSSPLQLPSESSEDRVSEPAPPPATENSSRNEPEPFIDPLDNLPPFEAVPLEPEPRNEPIPEGTAPPVLPRNEPEPFVDPLDNFPPFDPVPGDSKPAEEFPAAEPMVPVDPAELDLGVLRMPRQDESRFLLESRPIREKLSEELRLDAWDRYHEPERQIPWPSYWEKLSREEKQRLEQDLSESPLRTEYDPGPEPARTDLNVGIEKRHPANSTAHEPLKYEIVVENRGREMIDSVDVDEAVPASHQLTNVSPAGYFERHLLRWRLRELRPGESRRLSVEVVPTETGTIETMTSIRPTTRVSFLTQVENANTAKSQTEVYRTPLRLRRSGYRTVALAERVLFTNHIQNLSNATQRDVEIVEQVPAGFRVIEVEGQGVYDPQGQTITWQLAALPAGETAKLGVHLEAESTGELVSRVKALSKEGEAVPIKARVQVNRFQAERITTPARPGPPLARCSQCQANCCCPACCCR